MYSCLTLQEARQQAVRVQRRQVRENRFESPTPDLLVIEEPLEMRLNGQALSVTMRTPGDDENLVRGFLYTEQIVDKPEQILSLDAKDNIVSATVPEEILKGKCWLRNFYASSSCGVCGKASIEQLKLTRPIVESEFKISASKVYEIPVKMRQAQSVFDETGGLHAAVLFDEDGKIASIREDIGRHNAVDKVIGWAMSQGRVPVRNLGLFVSGRLSFEILQKAIAAGIPLVGAVSAPSSLAVALARDYHVTILGFVRGQSMSVYVDEQGRIDEDHSSNPGRR